MWWITTTQDSRQRRRYFEYLGVINHEYLGVINYEYLGVIA